MTRRLAGWLAGYSKLRQLRGLFVVVVEAYRLELEPVFRPASSIRSLNLTDHWSFGGPSLSSVRPSVRSAGPLGASTRLNLSTCTDLSPPFSCSGGLQTAGHPLLQFSLTLTLTLTLTLNCSLPYY